MEVIIRVGELLRACRVDMEKSMLLFITDREFKLQFRELFIMRCRTVLKVLHFSEDCLFELIHCLYRHLYSFVLRIF